MLECLDSNAFGGNLARRFALLAPELTRTVRGGADGLMRLPMLKQRIKAEIALALCLPKRVLNRREANGSKNEIQCRIIFTGSQD